MLDFSGFGSLSQFAMSDIEFQCNKLCSGIRLAPSGLTFQLRDCFISRPKDRGVTSIGTGCQGILIDRCQFLSSEESLDVPDRTTVAINVNANDPKLRNNRATRFKHFALLGGANSVVLGNHFFQGDDVTAGVRTAGLIIANNFTNATITGNYIDNCTVEWTNERDPTPDFNNGFSFSAMSITDNIMLLILSSRYLGFVPLHFAEFWLHKGSIRELRVPGSRVKNGCYLIHRKTRPLGMAAGIFKDTLIDEVRKHVTTEV